MSRSVRYEPVLQSGDESLDAIDGGRGGNADDFQPLRHNKLTNKLPSLFGRLFSKPHASYDPLSPSLQTPTTPISSDGVFTNIPAKPSSSQEHKDEELDEDEWIFMTPEQRKALKPPKYSRVKRDRAPRYTTEYTPPQLPPQRPCVRKKRRDTLDPLVNSLPAGSSRLFIAIAFLCTVFPILGVLFVYTGSRGRWGSHASRLGARTGFGLGLLHLGAMVIYIPALLPGIFATSSTPLIVSFIWTTLVGFPLGWRLFFQAAKEFMWVQTQERVLRGNLGLPDPSSARVEEDDEDDIENGQMFIEGTDIRVRDLRKILAKARDARLARSLRAAGF